MKSKHIISIQDILENLKSNDNCIIAIYDETITDIIDNTYDCLIIGHSMYLTTLSKHLHVNNLMLTVCEIHCLVQLKSITCASLSGSPMSILVDPMTRECLDTNIIIHDRNLIIMISS